MEIYIYQHLGLGDHIICNGLMRNLIKPENTYIMLVYPHNMNSISFMYRDIPNLKFLSVNSDYEAKKIISEKNADSKIIAGFGMYSDAKSFDDSFYLQNNIDFEKRWTDFKCIRDMNSEMNLFHKYDVKENEYVFIHDDIDRNLKIDESYIIHKEFKIIRPIKGYTENIFDYCYLMQHSIESHFIDSSFRLVFDSFQLRNSNIFYHFSYKSVNRYHQKAESILNYVDL